MRIQLTDPVEIFKAFIQNKTVYKKEKHPHHWFIENMRFTDAEDTQQEYWIEENDLKDIRQETQKEQSWQDELKHICRSGWVKEIVSNIIYRVDGINWHGGKECIQIGNTWISFDILKETMVYAPKPDWME